MRLDILTKFIFMRLDILTKFICAKNTKLNLENKQNEPRNTKFLGGLWNHQVD